MSHSLILKATALSLLGLTVGAGVMRMWDQGDKTPLRTIAAVNPRIDHGKQPLFLGKHLSVVQVSLQTPDGIPADENQEVTLVGSIRLNRAVDSDLRFRWELPEGVHVVSGQVESSWSGVQVGDVSETRLTVTGFSNEDLKLIALHGYVQDGDSTMGNSATLTSRPEDSLEMAKAASGIATRKPSNEDRILKGKIIR